MDIIKNALASILIIGGVYAAYFRIRYLVKKLEVKLEQEKKERASAITIQIQSVQKDIALLQKDIDYIKKDIQEQKEVLNKIWDKLDQLGA